MSIKCKEPFGLLHLKGSIFCIRYQRIWSCATYLHPPFLSAVICSYPSPIYQGFWKNVWGILGMFTICSYQFYLMPKLNSDIST